MTTNHILFQRDPAKSLPPEHISESTVYDSDALAISIAFQRAAKRADVTGQPVRIKFGASSRRIFEHAGETVAIVTRQMDANELGTNAYKAYLALRRYKEGPVQAMASVTNWHSLENVGHGLRCHDLQGEVIDFAFQARIAQRLEQLEISNARRALNKVLGYNWYK